MRAELTYAITEIGRSEGRPIALLRFDAEGRDWLSVSFKQGVGPYLRTLFWGRREDDAVAVEELVSAIKDRVQQAGDDRGKLFDIISDQPAGWDRWLSGIPLPVQALYDAQLRAPVRELVLGEAYVSVGVDPLFDAPCEFFEIGHYKDRPNTIIQIETGGKTWIGLYYWVFAWGRGDGLSWQQNFGMWSTRDPDAVAAEELILAVKNALKGADDDLRKRLDVASTRAHGWDTWGGGTPSPVFDLFDHVLRKPIDRLIPGSDKKKCSC